MEIVLWLRNWKLGAQSFPNSFKGQWGNLFPPVKWDDEFCWMIFFIGLVGISGGVIFRKPLFSGKKKRERNEPLVGRSLLGGFFLVDGEWANFWLIGGNRIPCIPLQGICIPLLFCYLEKYLAKVCSICQQMLVEYCFQPIALIFSVQLE